MPYRPSIQDRDIIRYAATQGGVVSREQLLLIGYTDSMVRTNITGRRWSRILPDVYNTVTGTVPFLSWWWAAHLYAGSQSSLYGHTALQAWGLERPVWPLHLAVPANRQLDRVPAEFVVHRHRRCRPVRIPTNCPPASTVADALLDALSALDDIQDIASLVTTVCQKRRSTVGQLEGAIAERQRIRHRSLISTLIAEMRDGVTTVLEIPAMRKIFRAHGLPVGRGQVRESQHGAVVVRDRLIERFGIVVEFDGRLGHDDPRGRLRDHRRDNAVALSGRTTLRFGWVDVHHEACESATQIAAILHSRGWTGAIQACSPTCRAIPTR